MKNITSDAKKMRALPIKSLIIHGGGIDSGNSWILTSPHLLNESNIIIEDLTIKSDRGGNLPIGVKVTATIYYSDGGTEIFPIIEAYKSDYKRIKSVMIELGKGGYGREGAFSAEGRSTIEIMKDFSINIRSETVPGFYRHVVKIEHIAKGRFMGNNDYTI